MNIATLLREHARRTPGRVALIHPEGKVTLKKAESLLASLSGFTF